jgi:hypothetical protein
MTSSAPPIESLADYALALEAVKKLWKPHPKQVPVGQAVFRDGCKRVMLCMGRRFGKSNLIANIVTRVALAKPFSACVILCPTIKAAKKIYWLSGIIKNMVPKEYVESINNTELRIVLTNGSYIEITGADDPDSLRGTGISIYAVDEYKDHKPNVLTTITPALIDNNGILLVGGTPPGTGGQHHFWDLVEESKTDPDWKHFHATSYDNPYLDPAAIDKERRQHEARGEVDVFTREYMAMPALSVKHSVYGMFDRKAHVHRYESLRAKVLGRLGQWTLMVAMDPGSASVFAALIGAVNNHTGEVVFIDELYSDKVVENSIGTVWPKVKAKMDEFCLVESDDSSQFTVVYDEAATWVRVELDDVFDVAAIPTQKSLNRKSFGVSLIKDLLLNKKIYISERCVKFMEEMEGYQTDDKGNFIKARDHALDCARYLIHGAHFTARESAPPTDEPPIPYDERRRAFTPEEDFEAMTSDHAPIYDFEIPDYD